MHQSYRRTVLSVGLALGTALAVAAPAAAAPASPVPVTPTSATPSASASASPSVSASPSLSVSASPSVAPTSTWDNTPRGKYRLDPRSVTVGAEVDLIELEIVGDQAPPVYISRRIDWGDGSSIVEATNPDFWGPHTYAEPGTYQVTVRLSNVDGESDGVFADGNTVTVVADGDEPGQGGGSGDDGGLPVTGPTIGIAAGAGVALVLAGAAAFWTARRRRVRFTAGH